MQRSFPRQAYLCQDCRARIGGMKKIKTEQVAAQEDLLQQLVSDYTTQKQQSLMQMKKGQLSKEAFLAEAAGHIAAYYKGQKSRTSSCWTRLNSMFSVIPDCQS